jgi:hypothetical protein
MGDLAAKGIPLEGASSPANMARAAQYMAAFAKAAGGALALGQIGLKAYDAITGEATVHDVMSTAFGGVLGIAAGSVVSALIGTALFPAVITAAISIGVGFVVGKIGEALYDRWGQGLTKFLTDTGSWWANAISGWIKPEELAQDWTTAKHTLSPLILDLDGDGVVETQSKIEGIHFDHAGDGFAESTGWAASDDGLLVRDLNGDGAINNGGELFGNNTRLSNGQNAANGFEALKDLDSNKDGKLNSADTAWNTLRVWKDTDGDAKTDTGELLTLAEAGVKEFKLAYTDTSSTPDQHGNEHKQTSSYTTTAGTVRAVHDVWFGTDNWNTIDQRTPVELSIEVAALPELIGSGNLGSLRQAMMRDASGNLTAAVSAYSLSGNASTEEREMLLQDIDPASRRPFMYDGRKLAVQAQEYSERSGGRIYASKPIKQPQCHWLEACCMKLIPRNTVVANDAAWRLIA